MRFDPKDPAQPRQRSLRAVEGTRRADSVRRVGRSRRVRSRRAAEAARRSAPISKAIRRLGCRSSTSRPVRSARASAPRSAPRSTRAASGPTTAPTCCSATASRRKGRSGKRPTSRRWTALDNLCGITDVNALGQSRPTMWQHDMEQFARRWRAFGWHAIVVDGHDLSAILDAFAEARRTKGQPTMILARTIKGKGVSFVEGQGRLARPARSRRARSSIARSRSSRSSSCPCPTAGRPRIWPARFRSRRRRRAPSPHRSRCRRRPTRWAITSRRARRTARRSPSSATRTRASWRSTPT